MSQPDHAHPGSASPAPNVGTPAHGHGHGHAHAEPPPAPGESLADKAYLPAMVKGLGKTLMHFIDTLRGNDQTVQFPEKSIYDADQGNRAIGHPNPRYRGEHILVKDDQGREKCVACLLCMSACPALCIYIEPAPAPAEWKDRERRPGKFEIDMLRCIYCGYCEEACPCDAIRLTPKFYQPTFSRAERVYDKPRLLENNPEAQQPQRPKK
jgi:NADH-quinone oxidoreductase subunit I